MTPRYRTAFSAPSGFVAASAGASMADTKTAAASQPRKSATVTRMPATTAKRDARPAAAPRSSAAA